ncbi:MAG: putative quinol monooxygenase [Pollutimonas bauzanensis]|uniref:Quinol monooxygenase YgiN n=1 Tax=Pollutimonas bauzanensis TaxID=658167 RepID=A0A1M5WDQ6_9BURK|nr:putative quinol monooxygenase [Pollutimonas bauzanensis]SHH85363.1 Quinol monooxygenase YgiN [Pollutimonas bauzanensis]
MLEALIVEFKIKPEFVEDFALAIQKNAASALEHEAGCRYFDICRDPADASLFFLYELYENEDAIEAHRNSKHYQEFAALSTDWVAGKSVRKMRRIGASTLG